MTGIEGLGDFPTARLIRGPVVSPLGGEGLDGGSGAAGGTSGFGDMLFQAIRDVQGLSDGVTATETAFVRGDQGVELHDIQVAIGKSKVAFDLMLEVRNKLVDAWQTLSRSVM